MEIEKGREMITSFVAIDLETTGLSPEKHQIIEVGALRVREGKVVDTYSVLIHPGDTLPEKIVEITKITDAMLVGAKSWKEVCGDLKEFIGEDILLGHNVGFDYRFLKTNFMKEGYAFEHQVIDTLAIAKAMHSDLPSRSLEAMCAVYGLHNKSAHRALEDASVTMELYFAMMESFQKSGQCSQTIQRSCQPKSYEYRVTKEQPITIRQKNYLLDLVKYHKIDKVQTIENLTKSQASRMIDQIIFKYGKMQ